jgi:hypothetical protein
MAENPRAYARGYDLSPLCGSNWMRFARHLAQLCLIQEGWLRHQEKDAK